MKTFFTCMLALSILSGVYQVFGLLGVIPHNPYEGRYQLLDAARKQPNHVSSHYGLTAAELANSDPYFADAYREAVSGGYRLGMGYIRLWLQCLSVNALLFISSILGMISLGRK